MIAPAAAALSLSPPPSTASLPPDRRGRLRNGASPGDFLAAPRCGARTRAGGCCRQPAMRNGRCRLYGGLSTGPRTAEGRARCARARLKHGAYSRATRGLMRKAAPSFAVYAPSSADALPLGMGCFVRIAPLVRL